MYDDALRFGGGSVLRLGYQAALPGERSPGDARRLRPVVRRRCAGPWAGHRGAAPGRLDAVRRPLAPDRVALFDRWLAQGASE